MELRIGPLFLLALVFVVLKLVGAIAWSWWWVLCPIWIPLGLAALFFLAAALIAILW